MDIALVQQYNPSDAMDAFQRGLIAIKNASNAGADLVVFPELSFTKFFPQVPASKRDEGVIALAEKIPGPTVESVAEQAAEYEVVVVCNLYEDAGGTGYNSSVVIDSDGTVLGVSRMMHIPQYEHFYEQDYYTPGDTGAPVFDTAVGKIGVATCYDRHFPEYMRGLALGGAEVVCIPQAGAAGEWAKGVFEAEIQAMSFQNGFFCALANRVGREDDILFDGASFVTDPHGRIVAQAPKGDQSLLMASADLSECDKSPARQLFLKNRREDQYTGGAVPTTAADPAGVRALEGYGDE